jgi:AsmA protein
MAILKPLKIIGIIAGAIAALIVVAVVTASIMFPPAKIKALLVPQVEKAVGRSVTVDKAGISFFPVFGVKISNLAIGNTTRPQFSPQPFLRLERFVLKLKVLPLLRKKLEIVEIILARPEIILEADSTGAWNYDDMAFMATDAPKPAEKKPAKVPMLPIPLTLEKFVVEQGRIIYNDMKGHQKYSIGAFSERIDFNIDKQLRNVLSKGSLAMSDISIQTGAIAKPLSGINLTLEHDVKVDVIGGELVINDLRLSLQKIYLALTGTVKNFNNTPELDLSIKTDPISLADLLAEIPAELSPEIAKTKAEGAMELAVTVKGVLGGDRLPSVKGQFALKDGKIHYTALPQAITDINAGITFTENSLAVNQISLKLGDNPITIRATIENFKAPLVDAAVDATLNLDIIKDITKLPVGTTIGGMVKANIKAKGAVDPADPSKLDLKGVFLLDKVAATTPAVLKPVVVNGTIDLTSRAIAQRIMVTIGGSSMNLTGELVNYLGMMLPGSKKSYPRPKLTFTLASPLLNTDEFLPKADTTQKDAASAPAQSGPPVMLLAAPLPAMDLIGSITTTRLIYQGIELSNLNMKVNGVNEVLNLLVKANLLKGSFYNDFQVDARNTKDLKVKSIFNVDNVEVSAFIRQFKGMLPKGVPLYNEMQGLDQAISGTMNLKTDFVTHGGTAPEVTKNLEGTVAVKLADGKLKKAGMIESICESTGKIPVVNSVVKCGDIDFSDMQMKSTVKDEKANIDTMRVASRYSGDWAVNGVVGFDCNLAMNLENRMTGEASNKIIGVTGKGAEELKGYASKLLGAAGAQIAGKIVDQVGPQADKDGRVTALYTITGPVSKPIPLFKGFKKGVGGQQAAQPSVSSPPQQTVTQTVKQEAENVVKQAEELKNQTPQQAEQTIKKEADNLKKKLKGLGF